jgi:glycosyltransferase involved in cell wall biosynthesis
MRILMVVPFYPYPIMGGLEKQAHELARALSQSAISVTAVGVRFHGKHPATEVVDGVEVVRLPWPQSRFIRFITSACSLVMVMMKRRHDYDVVHIHQHSWFGLSAVLIARLLGKPSLIKLPNVGNFGIPGMQKMRFGWLRVRLLKLADGIVSMSQESGRELEAIRYAPTRVFWTTNGITLGTSTHTHRDNRPELLRVVFVGRLMEQKGIVSLLHAWQIVVSRTSSPCVLELWGDGPLAGSIKETCSALGLTDRVVMRGHMDGVREKLNDTDIFVLPSLNEGNSNALLEAMAAGLPCVATRVGGTPLLVGSEGAPWLCEPGEAEELADKLVPLIENDTLRKELGQAMRSRIEKYFDIRQVATSYASAYRCLLEGHRDDLSSCRTTWPAEQASES